MKFEFCGKLDCPDWILAQLFHASQMPVDKFEIVCTAVGESLLECGRSAAAFDECKFFTSLGFYDDRDENDSTGGGDLDLDFDIDDARACFAAVHYIVTNTCLYGVATKQLAVELEQLGLAAEHSRVICTLLGSMGDLNLQVHRRLTQGLVEAAEHSRGGDGHHDG